MLALQLFPILYGPATLLLGLCFPDLAFSQPTARAGFAFTPIAAAVVLLLAVDIDNAMMAYLLGFLAAWIAARSITMFWVYEPRKDFVTVRLVPKADSFGAESLEIEWKRFPSTSLLARLAWVLDLLLDTRALSWCYSGREGRPCQFHHSLMAARYNSGNWRGVARNLNRTIVMAILRVLLGIAWVACCQTYILPPLRAALQDEEYQRHGKKDWRHWSSVNIISFLTSFSAAFAFVEIFHSASRLASAAFYLAEHVNSLTGIMQPSPWGSLTSLYYHGIAGFWGEFWHDYLQVAFRCIANWLRGPVKGSLNPGAFKIMYLFVVFAVSGIMHMCGSFMLPSHSHPVTGQLLCFVLQPIGIVGQGLLQKTLIYVIGADSRYRALQLLTTLLWLYWTTPLLWNDLLLGGYWDTPVWKVFT